MYCVEFDPSLGITDDTSNTKTGGGIWVDSETMNFFNAQRDNIYVSSSKYDVVQLRSMKTQCQILR